MTRHLNAILVALVVGGLAVYVLLGAAGWWEPLPALVPLIPEV
jgi:hypothetical protein|tara:strand:- start:282 stop:410 length:129 start_codon:yes stop_codon:yes gene_type:complete